MKHSIAVIAGDGVGPEVINEGIKVLNAASDIYNVKLDFTAYPFSGDYYLEHGEVLPDYGLKQLEKHEAIYFGAAGHPKVKPGIMEKELLLKLRFHFDQYVNLRPVKLYPGVETPLKNKTPKDINFYVVRENTEDFYVGIGDRFQGSTYKSDLEVKRKNYHVNFHIESSLDKEEEVAFQLGMITRKGSERVLRYAFELCKLKGMSKVTSVDKANVLTNIYGLWREIFTAVSRGYPSIQTEFSFVDAITMWFIKNPEYYQVVVTPNMFGDIITDLGAIIQGGLGLASGGNINPEGISMFEPIHGSAPKYAGLGIANPVATILAGQMMLEYLGEEKAAKAVEEAVSLVLKEGKVRTRDLGGSSSTSQVGNEIAKKITQT